MLFRVGVVEEVEGQYLERVYGVASGMLVVLLNLNASHMGVTC